MKAFTKPFFVAVVGVGSFLGLPLLTGCEVEHVHHDRVVYSPGYYYDREYYDPAGSYHKRSYHYYDGRRWSDRDGVPSGYTVRERQYERHYR